MENPFEKLSRQGFDGLVELVQNKIIKMPDNSVMWTPRYNTNHINQIASLVLETASVGMGDKVVFSKNKTLLGKDYLAMIGKKYSNSPKGAGIIICPHCYEKDETSGVLIKYTPILTGRDISRNDDVFILTCSNCKQRTELYPDNIVELGFGELKVQYVL